jgi:integrase
MAKATLRLVSPRSENRTVTPRRKANTAYRPREHLTEAEVERLIKAAKNNRWGFRDSARILIAFRHGLRASELCSLQWSDVEFESATLHLRRAKGGVTATHPLLGDELRALRALKREAKSPFIFVSERGAPFSVAGLAKLVERAGVERRAGLRISGAAILGATRLGLLITSPPNRYLKGTGRRWLRPRGLRPSPTYCSLTQRRRPVPLPRAVGTPGTWSIGDETKAETVTNAGRSVNSGGCCGSGEGRGKPENPDILN